MAIYISKEEDLKNTSSKFHGEGIYLELFKDLCSNLLDLIPGNFGVSKYANYQRLSKMRLIEICV